MIEDHQMYKWYYFSIRSPFVEPGTTFFRQIYAETSVKSFVFSDIKYAVFLNYDEYEEKTNSSEISQSWRFLFTCTIYILEYMDARSTMW